MSMQTILLSVSAVGLGLTLLICRRLADAHPAKWEELGGSFWKIFQWRDCGRFFRFLFSNEARALNDAALLTQVWCLRVIDIVATAALLLFVFRVA